MKQALAHFKTPALISLLPVFPLILMELINRRHLNDGFPIALFVVLWFLPVIFIAILTSIVRNVRAGDGITAEPVKLLLGAMILLFIALVWGSILFDQLPCFLGVPGCD